MSTNVNKYSFRRYNYTPILPLVYSDALSYIETLAQFSKKLNEVVEAINNVTTEAVELANEYTDSKVSELRMVVNEAVQSVEKIASDITTENENFIRTVNARLSITDDKVLKLSNELEADIKAVNERTDLAIQQNNEYILDELPKFLSQIKVLNFFTGERISVQDMFDYLSMFHLDNAITVDELIAKNNTYNQLTAYLMTYTDLVLRGGSIIQ